MALMDVANCLASSSQLVVACPEIAVGGMCFWGPVEVFDNFSKIAAAMFKESEKCSRPYERWPSCQAQLQALFSGQPACAAVIPRMNSERI